MEQNGSGKLADFTPQTLARIRALGATHIWYTGVVRHATATDYSAHGIPRQHPAVVKGKAGSPYAIADYYDIDPDLAEEPAGRMAEWEALVERTHKAGMGVVMDFVPNHVARQYRSVAKPAGVADLGEGDDTSAAFLPSNNFYYIPGQDFAPGVDLLAGQPEPYRETPAKATGNDRFDSHPGPGDWYETVKLNYGVDYSYPPGHTEHFNPVPDTWGKMLGILLFWAGKGVDGFRCDMAEMVPCAFWHYAIKALKEAHPGILFIGEVYNPQLYRAYIGAGFDYLYDKVGMYDCLRAVVRGERPAADITGQWQNVGDIMPHMLHFLENHDEQRIASDFFCGSARKAVPALAVSALLTPSPFMLYAGQEFGERGMCGEGFSGVDGRTTIFDYWALDTTRRGYFDRRRLTKEERALEETYKAVLGIKNGEKCFSTGAFFDLMYVNPASDRFDPATAYAFMRKEGAEAAIVAANFSGRPRDMAVRIPTHAFEVLGMAETKTEATDLLTGEKAEIDLKYDGEVEMQVPAHGVRVYKFSIAMEEYGYGFGQHNKDEFPPAHTAEHLLNQLMTRMFGCKRSTNAHIERKKSKISFIMDHKPDRKEEREIERRMNELIEADLPVAYEVVERSSITDKDILERLPADAGDTIRMVKIGDFDTCPCIGRHVRSTAQIGRFEMLGTNWDQEKMSFRIRYKVVQ